ncbi:hypothetical protein [Kribbella koreensis]|uniref:hypothetical protein n=1 Tax=Kribbella koreensis TaxID=57909 RepID=UPI0031DD736C
MEGVLRGGGEPSCWYFKLFAERWETNLPDDRLFALRRLSDADSLILGTEFGFGDMQNWIEIEAQATPDARRIIDNLGFAPRAHPDLILRTSDFVTASDVWSVTPADRYGAGGLQAKQQRRSALDGAE